MPKFDAKKLILYMLWLPGSAGQYNEPIEGVTRLQKMMFLFEKEIMPELKKCGQADYVAPNFIAYKFGPYSNDIFDNLRFFISTDFVSEKPTGKEKPISELVEEVEYDYDIEYSINEKNDFDRTTYTYMLSEKGKRFVNQKLTDLFTEKQKELLVDFKKRINSLPLNAILQYVYKNYEDMTLNSEIKDKVLS